LAASVGLCLTSAAAPFKASTILMLDQTANKRWKLVFTRQAACIAAWTDNSKGPTTNNRAPPPPLDRLFATSSQQLSALAFDQVQGPASLGRALPGAAAQLECARLRSKTRELGLAPRPVDIASATPCSKVHKLEVLFTVARHADFVLGVLFTLACVHLRLNDCSFSYLSRGFSKTLCAAVAHFCTFHRVSEALSVDLHGL